MKIFVKLWSLNVKHIPDFAYTNMTAAAVRETLLAKGWTKENMPSIRTMSDILFRHEYRLRSVAKTRVQKKRMDQPHLREHTRGKY